MSLKLFYLIKVSLNFIFHFIDIDECLINNGDCQQICINQLGTHTCGCKEGFSLKNDNKTCLPSNVSNSNSDSSVQAAYMNLCYANCDSIVKMQNQLDLLHEKVSTYFITLEFKNINSGNILFIFHNNLTVVVINQFKTEITVLTFV